MLHKVKNGLVDIPMIPLFDFGTYAKYQGHKKKQPEIIKFRHKARAFQDSFIVSTVREWNKLCSEVVNSPSLEGLEVCLENLNNMYILL